MAHWFVIAGLLLLSIALWVIDEMNDMESWKYIGFIIGIVVLVGYLPITALFPVGARQEISVFEQQSAYIATHIPKNDIEDAALTQKKIELNEWLYKAQFAQDKWGAFSFYPESVQELEPIQ